MNVSDLHFDLPESQIAQEPASRRDHSRMLALDRSTGDFRDCRFYDIVDLLRAGDVVVLNNTRVFPARLLGRREDRDGVVEIFLVREKEPNVWETLVRPGRRVPVGCRIVCGDGRLVAEVVARTDDGRRHVRFSFDGDFFGILEEIGRTPLPPYIHRAAETDRRLDRESYQTVYAKERGSVAAPTAGLHFTPEVLGALRAKGVEIAELTLHVGYGTFQPVRTENLAEHKIEAESYCVSTETAQRVSAAKRDGRRVIAVGTTSTRTLESVVETRDGQTTIRAGSGATDLVITPGHPFRALDGLLTNFHLPGSSLLALVVAFGGYAPVMRAYRHAVAAGYRFYSYGDCMLLL
jgi:S-adenosylmethionine:tRNA ribosyltransferase-isomerase